MTELNTVVTKLKSLSQYNPVFKSKIKEFESLLHSALIEKQINAKQYETYKEIIPKSESGLDNIMLFVNLSTQNYYPCNYDMLKFLDTRVSLYELHKKLCENSVSFSNGFQKLLFDLNKAMANNSENFWDLYFVLLICLYANYNLYEADIINQNKKEILIIIKYATEEESRLLVDLSSSKMKLFAEISPDIGKDNVTKFFLVKTLFTDKANHISMLKEIAQADKMYLSQYCLTEVLCSNHVKLNSYYSPKDIIELCLMNKILINNLWVFNDRKSEILGYMSHLFSYIIDQLFYTFIVHMIFSGKKLDGAHINSVVTLQNLLTKLDTYNVETYAVAELEQFIMTIKE